MLVKKKKKKNEVDVGLDEVEERPRLGQVGAGQRYLPHGSRQRANRGTWYLSVSKGMLSSPSMNSVL